MIARKLSRAAAINSKCRDCIHDDHAPGSWRAQVAQCAAVGCPLWPWRPAPRSGPFASPPRDPENVTPEWRRASVGSAFSALAEGHAGDCAPRQGVAEVLP